MSKMRGTLPKFRRSPVTGLVLAPTRKHRPAIWENMLGTVYAMDAKGNVKYFDYDYAGAVAFAGIVEGSDVRRGRYEYGVGGGPSPRSEAPRSRQTIWWVAL